MRTRTRGQDVIITVHTYSNRNTGIFVIFLGAVATWPLAYMYDLWFSRPPKAWSDWYVPAVIAAVLVCIGFLLAVASYKKIVVSSNAIRVTDGPLHRPLTFHWKGAPAVRLQSILSEHNERPQTTWIVKLINERYEYTLDERMGQQLESRGVAEAVAKSLGCSLLEKDEDGNDVVIDARDLDLPFSARVKKYPALLGHPIPQPANAGVNKIVRNGSIEFVWGIVTGSLLLSMVALGLVFFIVSAIPPKPEQASYLEQARRTGDYHLYIWTAAVIASALLITAGFRIRVELAPSAVHLSETLWGIPVSSRTIPAGAVEEVALIHTVRGPVVEIVGDRTLIQFRTTDAQVAGWLAGEIRAHLAGSNPS